MGKRIVKHEMLPIDKLVLMLRIRLLPSGTKCMVTELVMSQNKKISRLGIKEEEIEGISLHDSKAQTI